MSGPTLDVSLAAITVDQELQPRCQGTDESHIEALMQCPETWPPVVLFRRGDELILGDGFHRLEAQDRLGGYTILAVILDPPADGDLARAAFELNAKHGRALTLADRKAYAARLAREHPELSDRDIGRRAYLHHETVGALRRGAASTATIPARKPGEIDPDVGLFDPIRWAPKATRAQKAVAGYLKRLTIALDDPYADDDGNGGIDGWDDDPAVIADACFAALGYERAMHLLESVERDAHFLAQIGKARKLLSKSYVQEA